MEPTSASISHRLSAVRHATPVVQCLTNAVVMNYTANVLLAAGSTPAMMDTPGEAGLFTRKAASLLINLGTPDKEQCQAITESVTVASEIDLPWVLDPVAIGDLPIRTKLAYELLSHGPTAIRGNPSEIIALAGAGTGGCGTDTKDFAESAVAAAHTLARRYGSVVAISGATDIITDGQDDIRLRNGNALLTRITGGGCALGAIISAFLAVEDSTPLQAVAAATATYTIAAEVAADSAAGPGSFGMHFLDALNRLNQPTFTSRLAVDL